MARFSTHSDRYEGQVVRGDFVRANVAEGTRLCLTLDTDRLQEAPGTLSSSDGRFHRAALRPMPQVWHDPLSTLSFGEGRVKNLLYVAAPSNDAGEGDVMVVLSLMQEGDVEVRLLRGAPGGPSSGSELFGVFSLQRGSGPCTF